MTAPAHPRQRRRAIDLRQAVLEEIEQISECNYVGRSGGWISPYEVRYFRRRDTLPAVGALTLNRIAGIMRGLAADELLIRHPRNRTVYKLKEPT